VTQDFVVSISNFEQAISCMMGVKCVVLIAKVKYNAYIHMCV